MADPDDIQDETPEESGIPERLKVKRAYTLSPAALEARRHNAQKSTGPTTDEGKSRCAKNAWRHGKYAGTRILGLGKPCKSTCNQYPCSLVEEGTTSPGGDCLNKEHLYEACLAIERALLQKDQAGLNELIVYELAESMQVIRELRRAILEDGVIVKSERIDKEGKVIGHEIKPHPALLALPNLMKNFGLTLPDFMLTPAAIQRVQTDKETADTLADIFRGAGNALKQAQQNKKG